MGTKRIKYCWWLERIFVEGGDKMQIWSIGTALRNPKRIPGFLNILNNFSNSIWDTQTQLDYYIELIRQGEVTGANFNAHQLNVSQDTARNLMYDRYKDAPIRGRVLGSLFDKLGFIDLSQGRLVLTTRGNGIINGTVLLSDALINGLMEWQYINSQPQWCNSVNGLPISQDFSPFVATLYLIGRVNYVSRNNTGITYKEFNYFAKTLDNYGLVDIFAHYIINSRINQNYAAGFIRYVDDNFINIRNATDYIDNDIKYFCESTLIQSGYIGNGPNCNFANLNYNNINQIRNIVNNCMPGALPI